MITAVSSSVVAASSTAIGLSLIGVTVTSACPVSIPPFPSDTTYVSHFH